MIKPGLENKSCQWRPKVEWVLGMDGRNKDTCQMCYKSQYNIESSVYLFLKIRRNMKLTRRRRAENNKAGWLLASLQLFMLHWVQRNNTAGFETKEGNGEMCEEEN